MSDAGPGPNGIIATLEADASPHFLAPKWKSLAQLFLDTTAFNGHGTLSQMLWMAVPTLTRPLERIGQRIGASVVLASAAPELVAQVAFDHPKRTVSNHASGTQSFPKIRLHVEGFILRVQVLWFRV